ncbi:MAG: hypothetical protein P8Y48_17745 [Novosphingobium sp.]
MRTLTRIAAPALVAALGLSAALPASARETRHYPPARHTPARDHAIRADIQGLRARIDRAAARHTISYHEAAGLRRDAGHIQHLYARYARNGLSRNEVRTLRTRVGKVQFALRSERHDRDGRRG